MKKLMKNCPEIVAARFESWKKVENGTWHLFVCNYF